MINHKSYRMFRDVARSCSTSLAAGVDADNKRIALEKKKATESRERNAAYWRRMMESKTKEMEATK